MLEKYKGMYWHALHTEMAAFWKSNDTMKPFCQNAISGNSLKYGSKPVPRHSLHVCHLAYTFYEGDNRVIRYAEMMHEQGNDVEVVALREKGQEQCTERNGIRVFHLQHRTVNEKYALTYLVKLLFFLIRSTIFISLQHLRRPYHVLHVHNMPDFLVFAVWLPKLTGAKIILDIHDILPELFADKFGGNKKSFLFRLLLLVERMSCAFADHVIVANDIWRDRLISRSVSENKCTTIMNYPNLQLFKPLPESEKRNDGKFVMIYPGSLNYHQGLDVAVKAFARIKDELPFIEFYIYGSGPAKEELIALVKELNLSDRIFFPPSLPIEEIAKIMARADLGIIPKRAEGFGNEAFSTKTLEFMACGVPIIVSDTRIDRYYFDDSIAVFFKSGDEEALAEAMRYAVQNQEKMRRLSQHALTFVSGKSWEKHKNMYDSILKSLLEDFSDNDKRTMHSSN
jgi:glycosyltransferase involved in cell wall biosynthesis